MLESNMKMRIFFTYNGNGSGLQICVECPESNDHGSPVG